MVCTEQGKTLITELSREISPGRKRSSSPKYEGPGLNHSQMSASQLAFTVSKEQYNKKALKNYFNTTLKLPDLEEKLPGNSNYIKKRIEDSKQGIQAQINHTPSWKKNNEINPINESFLPTFRRQFNLKEKNFVNELQTKQKSNLMNIFHDEFMIENHNRIRLNESKIERLVERYRYYLNKDKETKSTLDFKALVERSTKDSLMGGTAHERSLSKLLMTPDVETIMSKRNGEEDRYKERIERIHRIKYGKAWKDGYIPQKKDITYNKSSIDILRKPL